MKMLEEMKDELYIDISDINNDELTYFNKNNAVDTYNSDLGWTNDLYDVNFPAFLEPIGHNNSLLKDAWQVDCLCFVTGSFL